jgi:ABC-type transport system involved in multi-copper enzyme maturation permease subunit
MGPLDDPAMETVEMPLDEAAVASDATVASVATVDAPSSGPDESAAAGAAHPRTRPHPLESLRRTGGGIAAISVKELRGRMRGRRAFAILTLYLVLLGGFAWMVELLMEASYSSGFGQSPAFATAQIGQGIFAALIMLETLQVVFLAPASTAGAISLEREKQTLGLLVTTPISSVAIVVGKLLSALTYVFLLIAASIPLTAIVFVFGGVAPEDVVRAYIVLLVTALGLGAFGLCCSSLVKRTQAATAISIFGVLAITVGSVFLLVFWTALANDDNGQGRGPIKGRAPEVIAYVNPFLAQIDVMCGTEAFGGTWCGILSGIIPSTGTTVTDPTLGGGGGGVGPMPVPAPVFPANGGGVVIDKGQVVQAPQPGVGPGVDATAFGVVRDAFWPRSVITWLILSVIFLLISVQFVSPTRRWHLRRRRANAPAPGVV